MLLNDYFDYSFIRLFIIVFISSGIGASKAIGVPFVGWTSDSFHAWSMQRGAHSRSFLLVFLPAYR